MRVSRPYLAAVILLVVLAVVFGVLGTVAPPLAEEPMPEPQQGPSSASAGHFQNPPSYDSGWVNITTKAGHYVVLRHVLNTTNVAVDVTGKQSLDPMSRSLAWSKTYGGIGNDFATSVVQTIDGGYAIAGYTRSYGVGGADVWLVKTDYAGKKQWNETYGMSGDDHANSLVETSDRGYAIAGYTNSYGAGGWDFWLIKTDMYGNTLWSHTYGGESDDIAYFLVQTSDGGYALAGWTNSSGDGGTDFWLVKTDSAGNMLWNKTYGGTYDDRAYCVAQTSDGDYVLAGTTISYGAGGTDFWLVKTDEAGNMLWNKTYGGTHNEEALSVIQTGDGDYTLTGHTMSYGAGNYDFWLVRTDSIGTVRWNQTYGGPGDDRAYCVAQTLNEGYVIAGYTNSYGAGNSDLWFIRTDSAGDALWNMTYGGSNYDYGRSVVQSGRGGYVIAGYTNSYGAGGWDFLLVRVNADMNMEHQINFNTERGLTWTGLTNTTIILYRGITDLDWNYVHVRIWILEEPSWIYGDINMDGVVDAKDLYIFSQNYGKNVSLLSLGGIVAVAGIHIIKKRKQNT